MIPTLFFGIVETKKPSEEGFFDVQPELKFGCGGRI